MNSQLRLGKQIKSIRGARSQVAFASALNISQATLARYEQGRSTPKILTLRQIAAEGGVALDDLMDGRRKPQTLQATRVIGLEPSLNKREQKLVTAYRAIRQADRRLATIIEQLMERLKRLPEK